MQPITQWMGRKIQDLPKPHSVVATLSAQCNLSCAHCYWTHDMRDVATHRWDEQIAQIIAWGSSLLYAGRMLTGVGAKFLEQFIAMSGARPGIIDNGFTILGRPDLIGHYNQIAISIDGEPEDHDEQRGQHGAFAKAWDAILELQRLGTDPVIASALSPLSLRHWDQFERRVEEHDLLLSTTLVWSFVETIRRGVACLEERQVSEAFARLVDGVPKLINLYSIDQARILTPQLKRLKWRVDDDGVSITAEAPSGAVVIYRPESVLLVSELSLHWDGGFYTHELFTRGKKIRYEPSEALRARAQRLCEEEWVVWRHIL